MFPKSIFLFVTLLASQSFAFSLRGIQTQRKAPALPLLYCVPEKAACENDTQCNECLNKGYIPPTPEVDVDGFNCDDLVTGWFDEIVFEDDNNDVMVECNYIYGFPILTEYIYCLFDTYKYAAEIDICETGPTLAPTFAPTMSPIMMEDTSSSMTDESSSETEGTSSSDSDDSSANDADDV